MEPGKPNARFWVLRLLQDNFGPGDTELAHTAGERLEREPLERAYLTLHRLLSGAA